MLGRVIDIQYGCSMQEKGVDRQRVELSLLPAQSSRVNDSTLATECSTANTTGTTVREQEKIMQ